MRKILNPPHHFWRHILHSCCKSLCFILWKIRSFCNLDAFMFMPKQLSRWSFPLNKKNFFCWIIIPSFTWENHGIFESTIRYHKTLGKCPFLAAFKTQKKGGSPRFSPSWFRQTPLIDTFNTYTINAILNSWIYVYQLSYRVVAIFIALSLCQRFDACMPTTRKSNCSCVMDLYRPGPLRTNSKSVVAPLME